MSKFTRPRDRIGCRVFTSEQLGQPLDLGASWIHGDQGNPLIDLSRAAGARTIVTEEGYVFRGNGREIPEDDAPGWLDDVISYQNLFGASGSQINLWGYALENDYGGEDLLFPKGYGQLIRHLSKNLTVTQNWTLKTVSVTANGVDLSNARGRTVSADAAILTLPLGVLKSGDVTFAPALSKRKQDAIQKLDMGLLDKLYLKFDDVFWDADATWIMMVENGLENGMFNLWLNSYPYTGNPILVAFNSGPPAHKLSKMSDRKILAMAHQTLDRAYS